MSTSPPPSAEPSPALGAGCGRVNQTPEPSGAAGVTAPGADSQKSSPVHNGDADPESRLKDPGGAGEERAGQTESTPL